MRRQKSLRIGVHLANAVVWEPVYRTRLRHEARHDDGDEEDARRVKDAADIAVLAVEKARQQTREEDVKPQPRDDEDRVLHPRNSLVPQQHPQLSRVAVGELARLGVVRGGFHRELSEAVHVRVLHARDVRGAQRRLLVVLLEVVRPARLLIVRVERVDEILRRVVPGAIREPLLGEEIQRRRASGPPVREPSVVQQHQRVERVEHRGRGLVDRHHERAPLLPLQRAQAPRAGIESEVWAERSAGKLPEGSAFTTPTRSYGDQRIERTCRAPTARHRGALHLAAADAADETVAHVRVRASSEVELLDDFVDAAALVVEVLRSRRFVALGKLRHRREEDGLVDGGAAEEAVLLLDVRGVLLDRGRGRDGAVEVDLRWVRRGKVREGESKTRVEDDGGSRRGRKKDKTRLPEDFSLGLSLAHDVEEGRLPRAARAHDRAQIPGVHRARDLRRAKRGEEKTRRGQRRRAQRGGTREERRLVARELNGGKKDARPEGASWSCPRPRRRRARAPPRPRASRAPRETSPPPW
eukprot:29586-Pelagococcus_subviridis.AAC.7